MSGLWLSLVVTALLLIVVLLEVKRIPYALPKVVWTHWDSANPPDHVVKTVKKMKQVLPDWEVNFITTQSFLSSISSKEVPANFDTLGVAHQADWIRLKLLQKYGGCWMDSGILLHESINPLYRECVSKKADLLVFKILATQSNPRYPVAENWFIMAPANSPFVNLWLEEFEEAIESGFHSYKKQLKADGVDLQKLMMSPRDVYLTQHGCFQKVLQQRMPDAKIVYHVAEETMFKIHSKCNWKEECIQKTLQDVAYCKQIPYIKLRGADRKNVNLDALLNS
jgi:hypothetical protein